MAALTRGLLLVCISHLINAQIDPLHHLGGNGPYLDGPNVFNISTDPPQGCSVDQVAFLSRHGSRYPDPGAFYQWTNLSSKIQSASFQAKSPEFDFLHSWKPVLRDPAHELSLLSPGGWRELYDMGVQYRLAYPDLYNDTDPFVLWANRYQEGQPRVIDSARLFARGYLGPTAPQVGTVLVANGSDPRSFADSLAPSDICPNYSDNGGGDNGTIWANTYVPPIVDRINTQLVGLQFNSSDVVLFPYLCGFETQITGRRSPWCDTFTNDEILQYEYAQDLRYWYGTGLGSAIGPKMMLPILGEVIKRFVDGPDASYQAVKTSTFRPNKLTATFSNDGQLNQLISALGIFDDEPTLTPTKIATQRTYRASNFITMRGTVTFERLNCGGNGLFMRLKLNQQVYPVARCQNGPGRSCALRDYQDLIAKKDVTVGSFANVCGVANGTYPAPGQYSPFLEDPTLPFIYKATP